MGITLKQLTDTVSQIKDYILNKTHKIDQLNYAQKTVSTEHDYFHGSGNAGWITVSGDITKYFNNNRKNTNMNINENNHIVLKAGKKYLITCEALSNTSGSYLFIRMNGTNIGEQGYHADKHQTQATAFVFPEEDSLLSIVTSNNNSICFSHAWLSIQEIGHDTLIDPVEYINKTQGLEDSPVGHIISHMGTTAPKHYLICNGAVYNIVDYPYLAQHMIDNFGKVNYFGGDGTNTFAVPDLRGEFLRGTGTAKRNTGSGSGVGVHQNPTYIPNFNRVENRLQLNSVKGNNTNEQVQNPDKMQNRAGYLNITGNYGASAQASGAYSARPTNTAVLFCIKYEPTYYMQVKNTNYMQPNLYSEEERIVGCWINGKPLYEKTVLFTLSDTSNPQNVAHNIENIEEIVYSDINIANGTIPIGYRNNASTIWFTASIGLIFIELLRSDAGHWGQKEGKAVIQYTKTTDAENSFTNDMIQDYIIQSSESEPYSEEEVTNAVNEIWQ